MGQSFLNRKIWDVDVSSFWHAYLREIFCLALSSFFWWNKSQKIWPIFIILTFYDFMTMFAKKSLWWSFQNQKSQMYIFFNFPCWSSRDIFCFAFSTLFGGKLTLKMGNFHICNTFMIFENLSVCFPQICVTKFPK